MEPKIVKLQKEEVKTKDAFPDFVKDISEHKNTKTAITVCINDQGETSLFFYNLTKTEVIAQLEIFKQYVLEEYQNEILSSSNN